ncbi:hypothetical protein QQZ08_001529 [Neonectria magnoliae]|uniref:Uncharacterized protein n=1 Tax=Neonectria magnoliae TaxID=2732573 RepID=A0ABR1IE47_9HYPO
MAQNGAAWNSLVQVKMNQHWGRSKRLLLSLDGDPGGTAIGARSGEAAEEQAPVVPLRSAQFGARQNGVAVRLGAPVIG